tara:strand:+ start:800 stop:1048 length:249 start_codon:yes stop_codon:yes gene_type:complete
MSLSYSALLIARKSWQLDRREGWSANSIQIERPNLLQDTPADLWLSINSATPKKFCNVPKIPVKILTPPITAEPASCFSSGT